MGDFDAQQGYTLVELTAVIAIIAVILAISSTVFVRARRTQEILSLDQQIGNLVRQAKNSALAAGQSGSNGFRVYGVRFVKQSGADQVILAAYPSNCAATCGGTPISTINLAAQSLAINQMAANDGNLAEPGSVFAASSEAGIYFSTPFGRACARFNPSPAGLFGGNQGAGTTSQPVSVTGLLDRDYPIDVGSSSTNPNERHCNPQLTGAGIDTTKYVFTVSVQSTDATLRVPQTITINMFSGDVSVS